MKITNLRCSKKMLKATNTSNITVSKNLYGRIYLARNMLNEKVYIGKVEIPRSIEDRWKNI
jgi:hypothetical protein